MIKLIILWIVSIFICFGWNLQYKETATFKELMLNIIFAPILLLVTIGAILRRMYEYLEKE